MGSLFASLWIDFFGQKTHSRVFLISSLVGSFVSSHNSWPRSASQDYNASSLWGVVIFISTWKLFRVFFPLAVLSRPYADHLVDETGMGKVEETVRCDSKEKNASFLGKVL